ncbi:MAG: lysophospholipid acyltransferase family protein [Planctomycetales bacterium]
MNHFLRFLFYTFVVRPLLLVVLGLHVRHRERLPAEGPALVVANHNSHLDALVLATLFPTRLLPKVRPVAAEDYFFRNRLLKWFALRVVGIIPIPRVVCGGERDPLAKVCAALEAGEIVIFFPEGGRGEPERLGEFKSGVCHVAKRMPEAPVLPVFMHGFGKALPKGEAVLVPFFCDVFVGEPLRWTGDKHGFLDELNSRMNALAAEGRFAAWE